MSKRSNSHDTLKMIAIVSCIVAFAFLIVVYAADFLVLVGAFTGKGRLINIFEYIAWIAILVAIFFMLIVLLDGAPNGLRYTLFILLAIIVALIITIMITKAVKG